MVELPIYLIIGPPRSGSTVLYQAITNSLDVGYISNLHARFYGGISYVEKYIRPLKKRKPHEFVSTHGLTKGKTAPNECGEYWYQFFQRKPHYVELGDVNESDIKRLRNSLSRIASAFQRPIVFKNMNCALRLQPLLKFFPELRFIVTHRDIGSNAASLLQVRKRVSGKYDKWWSMEPRNVAELYGLEPGQQVVEQIQQIHQEIELRRKSSEVPDQFLDVCHEEFCSNPDSVIETIRTFIASKHSVSKLGNVLPARFARKTIDDAPPEIKDLLEPYVP